MDKKNFELLITNINQFYDCLINFFIQTKLGIRYDFKSESGSLSSSSSSSSSDHLSRVNIEKRKKIDC